MSETETTYKLREGVEPFAVYDTRADFPNDSDGWCAYCAEGADDLGPHVHEIFVTREGASLHTADELVVVAHEDTAALVDGYSVPEWIESIAWDGGGYHAQGWCEDPDDSQALHDSMYELESALFDVGLSIAWEDGFVIERVREV